MRSILLGQSRTMAQDENVGAGREGDDAVWVIFDQDADRHCPYLTKLCGSSILISGISGPLIWFSNVFGVEEVIFHGVSCALHCHLNSKVGGRLPIASSFTNH